MSSKAWDVNSSNTSWHLSVQSYLKFFSKEQKLFLHKSSFSTDMKLYALCLFADLDHRSKNQSLVQALPSPRTADHRAVNKFNPREGETLSSCQQPKQERAPLATSHNEKTVCVLCAESQKPTWVNESPTKKEKRKKKENLETQNFQPPCKTAQGPATVCTCLHTWPASSW